MVTVTTTGSHGGGASTSVTGVISWPTMRAMQSGVCQVKLNWFTCDNYKDGCNTTYRNLPTRLRIGLRNSSNVQVGYVEWNKNELGVTKNISISPSGNFAVNSRFFFDNGTMYGTALPGQSCYETYPKVSFSISLTFTPYLG
ncbi:hypothetical protein MK786_07370 [Microbacterium sp. CFH 31415]|uniref:hypothetical protein n=1 Tax=Microbacterium sp. CFH 31415 TaxID=2921732 RepID=UPI001F141D24|nr:hypothetical protein [Microbacterium sp. CFH 31415]MCH6230554.1 hypothetical protein [Microbacterium sp. CFH 31415]